MSVRRSSRRNITRAMSSSGTARIHTHAIGGMILRSPCVTSIVNQQSARPSIIAPASPMNTRACARPGTRRFHIRNPAMADASMRRSMVCVLRRCRYAARASQSVATSAIPPAEPSRPSTMLIALITPSAHTTENGIAQW